MLSSASFAQGFLQLLAVAAAETWPAVADAAALPTFAVAAVVMRCQMTIAAQLLTSELHRK